MKKIIAILLAVMMIAAMAITVQAVTPALGAPDMPEIPDLSAGIVIELPEDFWDKWFEENPMPPMLPTEPTEPQETVPAKTDVRTPGSWLGWVQSWLWRVQ